MPSLMPGTPGAKEVYGVSIIKNNFTITIPPKAVKRYRYNTQDKGILITGRRGEGGFGLIKLTTAEKTVFWKNARKIEQENTVYWFNNKAYVMINISSGKFLLNKELMQAFLLKKKERLLVIKSTTVTMSFSPEEIFIKKFTARGFEESVKNISKLEIF